MKKLFLYIPFLLLVVLFSGCESKYTEFVVNKNLELHIEVSDSDGTTDLLLDFESITREQLDISDGAKIEKVYVKEVGFLIDTYSGHVNKEYNIQMQFSRDSGPYIPLVDYNSKALIDPNVNLLVEKYLNAIGTKAITDYLSSTLINNEPTTGKIQFTTTPVDGKAAPINLKITLVLGISIEYNDCFYTGNFGEDDCR